MIKPTIFFSHSSKDSESLKHIKNRIEEITAGTINIFMSSDGQSIPLGHNWIHKIEEGLNSASIMFVFISPNSINSGWIYFEAGYAYSKGIEVIPVGVGVDIASLNPPLSMLQGFNLVNHESLNNIIATINRKFVLKFPEAFVQQDFNSFNVNDSYKKINNLFSIIESTIYREYRSESGGVVVHDLESLCKNIEYYLEENKIPYSIKKPNSEHSYDQDYRILFMGVDVIFHRISGGYVRHNTQSLNQEEYIKFKFSLNTFEKALPIIKNILLDTLGTKGVNLSWYLTDEYIYLDKPEEIAAIIHENQADFTFIKNSIGSYIYKNINFRIQINPKNNNKKHLALFAKNTDYSEVEILELINTLYEIGIIKMNN